MFNFIPSFVSDKKPKREAKISAAITKCYTR